MSPHLDDLVPVSIEGDVCWLTPSGLTRRSAPSRRPGSFLLPAFDPYTLAQISH